MLAVQQQQQQHWSTSVLACLKVETAHPVRSFSGQLSTSSCLDSPTASEHGLSAISPFMSADQPSHTQGCIRQGCELLKSYDSTATWGPTSPMSQRDTQPQLDTNPDSLECHEQLDITGAPDINHPSPYAPHLFSLPIIAPILSRNSSSTLPAALDSPSWHSCTRPAVGCAGPLGDVPDPSDAGRAAAPAGWDATPAAQEADHTYQVPAPSVSVAAALARYHRLVPSVLGKLWEHVCIEEGITSTLSVTTATAVAALHASLQPPSATHINLNTVGPAPSKYEPCAHTPHTTRKADSSAAAVQPVHTLGIHQLVGGQHRSGAEQQAVHAAVNIHDKARTPAPLDAAGPDRQPGVDELPVQLLAGILTGAGHPVIARSAACRQQGCELSTPAGLDLQLAQPSLWPATPTTTASYPPGVQEAAVAVADKLGVQAASRDAVTGLPPSTAAAPSTAYADVDLDKLPRTGSGRAGSRRSSVTRVGTTQCQRFNEGGSTPEVASCTGTCKVAGGMSAGAVLPPAQPQQTAEGQRLPPAAPASLGLGAVQPGVGADDGLQQQRCAPSMCGWVRAGPSVWKLTGNTTLSLAGSHSSESVWGSTESCARLAAASPRKLSPCRSQLKSRTSADATTGTVGDISGFAAPTPRQGSWSGKVSAGKLHVVGDDIRVTDTLPSTEAQATEPCLEAAETLSQGSHSSGQPGAIRGRSVSHDSLGSQQSGGIAGKPLDHVSLCAEHPGAIGGDSLSQGSLRNRQTRVCGGRSLSVSSLGSGQVGVVSRDSLSFPSLGSGLSMVKLGPKAAEYISAQECMAASTPVSSSCKDVSGAGQYSSTAGSAAVSRKGAAKSDCSGRVGPAAGRRQHGKPEGATPTELQHEVAARGGSTPGEALLSGNTLTQAEISAYPWPIPCPRKPRSQGRRRVSRPGMGNLAALAQSWQPTPPSVAARVSAAGPMHEPPSIHADESPAVDVAPARSISPRFVLPGNIIRVQPPDPCAKKAAKCAVGYNLPSTMPIEDFGGKPSGVKSTGLMSRSKQGTGKRPEICGRGDLPDVLPHQEVAGSARNETGGVSKGRTPQASTSCGVKASGLPGSAGMGPSCVPECALAAAGYTATGEDVDCTLPIRKRRKISPHRAAL